MRALIAAGCSARRKITDTSARMTAAYVTLKSTSCYLVTCREIKCGGAGRLKRGIPLLVLLLIIPINTPLTQVAMARIDPHWRFDPWVGVGSHWNTTQFEYTAGSGYYGNFSCDGQVITFFVCDSANYGKFLADPSDPTLILYRIQRDKGTGNFSFITPSVETWHFVLNNTDAESGVQCHIDLYRDESLPDVTVTLSGSIGNITLPIYAHSFYVPGNVTGTLVISVTAKVDHFGILHILLGIDGDGPGRIAQGGVNCTELSATYAWDTTHSRNGKIQVVVEVPKTHRGIPTVPILCIVSVQNPQLPPTPVAAILTVITIIAAAAIIMLRTHRRFQ